MKKSTMRVALVMVMLVVLQALLSIPAFAADGPAVADNVQDARNACVQVKLVYTDENNEEWDLGYETGYFIDANYILTCNHGVTLDDETFESCVETFGDYFKNNYRNRIAIRVVIQRDVSVEATITEAVSADYDFAVLKLNTALNGITVLPIGNDDIAEVADDITCLGFPAETTGIQSSKEFTFEDVSVTKGTVSKFAEFEGTDHLFHTAILTGGCSGGPTINNDAVVVGMNRATLVADERYALSLSIGSIRGILDKFGIPYVDGTGATGNDEACDHEWGEAVVENCVPTYTCTKCNETKSDPAAHEYGEWSVSKEATVDAEGEEKRTCANCGNEETRPVAKLEKAPINWLLIGLIGGAFVIIAVVAVIIIVIVTGKKKAAPAPAPVMQRPMPQQPQQRPMNVAAPAPQAPQAPRPAAPAAPFAPANEGAGETTVLNEGAGETTVLGGGAGSSCTLIRKKNGEVITISAGEFVIGKERRRVNYCIADNNSISRAHAKIVTKGNDHFVVDMNSTNFTFVNGAKLGSGQEHILKTGDKIKLADEEFEFKA